jgi:hypothetical protein
VTQDEVLTRVQAEAIRSVRFLYCDNANIVRGNAAYAGALTDFIGSGVGLTVAMQGFCLTEHLAAGTALGPVGEVRLVPEEERTGRGIVRNPTTLPEAIANLEADGVLLEALGEPLAT